MRSFFTLLTALFAVTAMAQAPVVTPVPYFNWPGESPAWVAPAAGVSQRFEFIIDDLPANYTSNNLWIRPGYTNANGLNVDMSIDISVGVPNSATPVWAHNASRITVYPRAIFYAAPAATAGGGTWPSDPYQTAPWGWTVPFTTPLVNAPTGSIYVEIWVHAVTYAIGGGNTGWSIEGWDHLQTGTAANINTGRSQLWWNGPACAPPKNGFARYTRNSTTNLIELQIFQYSGVPTDLDVVNIGGYSAILPLIPIGNPPILCQPSVTAAVATFVLPAPTPTPSWVTMAAFPWLPGFNYVAQWQQGLRLNSSTGFATWLNRPGTFTTHYEPGVPGTGARMPGDWRYQGTNTTGEGGWVLGWL